MTFIAGFVHFITSTDGFEELAISTDGLEESAISIDGFDDVVILTDGFEDSAMFTDILGDLVIWTEGFADLLMFTVFESKGVGWLWLQILRIWCLFCYFSQQLLSVSLFYLDHLRKLIDMGSRVHPGEDRLNNVLFQ